MVRMELNHIPQYHIYTFPAHLQGQNGMFLPAPEQMAELAEAQPFWTMPLAAAFLPCYFSSLKRLGRATFSWTAKYYSAPILATDPALLPLALKDNVTNTAVPAMPGLVCLANAGLLFLCFCFFFKKKPHLTHLYLLGQPITLPVYGSNIKLGFLCHGLLI